MDLRHKKCVPCEGGVAAMDTKEAQLYSASVPLWTLQSKSLGREFIFKNFLEVMEFVNKVAEIAEAEGHHPDMHIYYNKVRFELTTHAVDGLSLNDFILAAKIDSLGD